MNYRTEKITRMARLARRRSAELHSAVSQICNLQRADQSGTSGRIQRSAECNSAIQQIENLRYVAARYFVDGSPHQALPHFHSVGAAQSLAFTGLFST